MRRAPTARTATAVRTTAATRIALASLVALAALAAGFLARLLWPDPLAAAPSVFPSSSPPTAPIAAPPPAPPRAPDQQTNPPSTYTLVDTWSDVPWTLTAGRYGDVADIGSAPDGVIYVLDGYHQAVHVLDPDGTPRRVFLLPSPGAPPTRRGGVAAARLDVGSDGLLYVLSTSCENCPPQARVDRLEPDGTLLDRFELAERYADIAHRADGRIYLARAGQSAALGPAAVDVLDRDGQYLESLKPAEMDTPIRLDVADDGGLYVLQEVVIPTPPNPGGGGGRRPPGPSGPASDAPRQAAPIPGVLLFAADHRYLETVPFDFGIDVAVGPAGVFVARYGQVFALREDEPITPLASQRWAGRVSLNVPAGGRLLGGLAHCNFQGMIVFDQPAARPAPHALFGALDRPPLEGPVYPLRLDAGEEAVVLQGRYNVSGTRPGATYRVGQAEPQSAQRWRLDGTLAGQLGVCGRTVEAAWTRDIAIDGATVYTADATCVTRRPDDAFPEWNVCLDGLWGTGVATVLAAVAADAGRVAVLDAGAGGVVILDAAGAVLAHWRLAPGGPGDPAGPGGPGEPGKDPWSPMVDLDLRGDRLLLADLGRARVEVRGLDGSVHAAWPILDSPLAAAFGPDGDVYVVGRGGWGMRYAPDGTLRALWPLPDREVQARDIAVERDGRVLVAFVGFDMTFTGSAEITDAGVWVFAPRATPPDETPAGPAACRVVPDKRAAPARIPLGATVDVALDVTGRCPAEVQPAALAIVFDTSRSMSWGYAMDGAKAAVLGILARLDPRLTAAALVTFDDAATLRVPLTRDLVTIGRHVAALPALGDTQMAGGIDLAVRQLTGPDRDPAARPMLLLVTDANPKDQTLASLAAARASGVMLAALVFEDGQDADETFLSIFEGEGGRVLFDPGAWEIAGFADGLIQTRDVAELLGEITVTDRIPANMRYILGSARPAAAFDAMANTLTWSLAGVPAASGLRLTYRLEPLEAGTWPTNVEAVGDYRDAAGTRGRLVFPIPQVTVYVPERHAAYLPFAIRQQCIRPERPVDVVLVLDTSVSMSEPAAPGAPATKLDAARAAASAFVDLLRLPADQAAIVTFSDAARRLIGLSGDRAALDRAFDGLAPTPGTRIDLGLVEARRVLADGHRPGAAPVVVLLSDGFQTGDAAPVRAAATALKATGAVVFTIGLGDAVDQGLLREAASSADRTYASPAAADLAAIYARISERLACEVSG